MLQVEINDNLKFYNGSNVDGKLIEEITGHQIPSNVSSCGNEMLVVFSSNSAGTSLGFNSTIHIHETPLRPEMGAPDHCSACFPCGVNEGHCQSHGECFPGLVCFPESCPTSLGFANTTSCCQSVDVSCGYADVEVGLLLSPNYPNNYQNNLECAHQLSAEPGKFITVEFESFRVSCLSKDKNLQQASKD